MPTASARPDATIPLGVVEVDDPRRADQRDVELRPRRQLGRDRVLGHGRGRGNVCGAPVGRGVAERHRDEVDEPGRAETLRDRRALAAPGGVGSHLVGGQAHTDGDPAPNLGADRLQHLHREAQPRVEAPAVLVAAQVRARTEELRREVAVRHRDLDAVDPAAVGVCRGGGVPRDDLADLGAGQRARLGVEARARDGGRRDRGRARRAAELLAPTVEELDEELCTVAPHRAGDALVAVDDGGQVAAEGVRRQQSGRVDGRGFEEDRADAAGRARGVVGDEVLSGEVVVDERRLMRRRDHAVGERDRANPQRGQQRGVGRHARYSLRATSRSGRTGP
jgi:hypothetical protein